MFYLIALLKQELSKFPPLQQLQSDLKFVELKFVAQFLQTKEGFIPELTEACAKSIMAEYFAFVNVKPKSE